MKQSAAAVVAGKRVGPSMAAVGGGSYSGVRSESDKEKTKMRERQRRAITTKIFHGLRKNGGYRLSPRADINEVLRELAKESGWIVEPDGTTYRSKALSSCPICGTMKANGGIARTPSSSIINSGGVAGGACSLASPHHFIVSDNMVGGSSALYFAGGVSSDGPVSSDDYSL